MYIYTVEYIYYNKMLKSCWKFEEIIQGFEVLVRLVLTQSSRWFNNLQDKRIIINDP